VKTTEVRRALEQRAGALHRGAIIDVTPQNVEYEAGGTGTHRAAYFVTVLVGQPQHEAVRQKLDELMAPEAVKAALERGRTLDGLVTDIQVTKCTGYQLHRRDETDLLGATWTVVTLT
jgi:hypothetical protein